MTNCVLARLRLVPHACHAQHMSSNAQIRSACSCALPASAADYPAMSPVNTLGSLGKYTTDQLLSMSAEAAKRAAAASRRGAIGTAVSSGRSLSVVDQALGFGGSSGPHVPGPGCYDVRVGLADSVAAAAARPSAVSVSAGDFLHGGCPMLIYCQYLLPVGWHPGCRMCGKAEPLVKGGEPLRLQLQSIWSRWEVPGKIWSVVKHDRQTTLH